MNGTPYIARRFQCPATGLQPGRVEVALRLHGMLVTVDHTFIFSRIEQQPVEIPLKPLALDIESLPDAGRPADFSGAVGQFSMTVAVEPQTAAIGDLITVRSTISGTGDFSRVTAPVIKATPAFKAYEARLDASEDMAQRKLFRQVLIPSSSEATNIAEVRFSFFDPRAGRYRTLIEGPYRITLAAETNGPAGPPASAPTGPRINLPPAHPIVALKPAPRLWRRDSGCPWYLRRAVWAAHLAALVALLAWAAVRKRVWRCT